MKNILFIYLLITNFALAQKMPDSGVNRVRITLADKTLKFEITSASLAIPAYTTKTYYWYGGNQVNFTQGGYSGKLLNGNYYEYYLNKNLKTEGTFEKGLKTGIWKTWDEGGLLLDMLTWKKGVKNGLYKIFGAGGKITEHGTYKLGKQNGQVEYFSGQDSTTIVTFKNGQVMQKDTASFWKKLNFFKHGKNKR